MTAGGLISNSENKQWRQMDKHHHLDNRIASWARAQALMVLLISVALTPALSVLINSLMLWQSQHVTTAARDQCCLLLSAITAILTQSHHQSLLADLLLTRDAVMPGCALPQHIHPAGPHRQLQHGRRLPALPTGSAAPSAAAPGPTTRTVSALSSAMLHT